MAIIARVRSLAASPSLPGRSCAVSGQAERGYSGFMPISWFLIGFIDLQGCLFPIPGSVLGTETSINN